MDSPVGPAAFVDGQYRICAGQTANFTATNGGIGYTYHWDLGGGSVPNNYDGIGFASLNNLLFATPGIYTKVKKIRDDNI